MKNRIIETNPDPLWKFFGTFLKPEIFFSIYPPFLAMGIRVTSVSHDYRSMRVELKLNFINKNYVGTHFGGALFSMTDPFYMLMLLKNLGENYIVWDKKASIDFIKATKEDVFAEFLLSEDDINHIIKELEFKKSIEKEFFVEVRENKTNQTIAKVHKILYIRKIKTN